jgi:hypothetical protein
MDVLATRGSLMFERGLRRSTLNGRPARSAEWASVGTTVIVAPKRLAKSFETTTQVRIFLGSTPVEGSQLIQRMSPRRGSIGSGVFIVKQLERRGFQIGGQSSGVGSIRPVRFGPLLSTVQSLATCQCFANQLTGVGRDGSAGFACVSIKGHKHHVIKCQV